MNVSTTTSSARPTLTLITACLAVLILPASLTGTSVAIPQINSELQPGLVELQWVVNAYNLTFAAFMLVAGSLSDILGRKRVFLIGTTVFALCSLASTVADDIVLLDLARGASGIGAAAMLTAGSALIANAFTGKALAKAFAVFGSAAGAGLAIGPSLSGVLVGALGWRAVFGSHLIVSLLILALALAVPAVTRAQSTARIDWAGMVTFTPALFAFVLGVMQGPQVGWTNPFVLSLGAVVIVFGALFVWVERCSAHPMFDFSLLRNPRFFTVCLIPVALAFSFVSLLIYLPIYLTAASALTSATVGVTMAILTVPVIVVPLLAGRLLARGVSVRWLLASSLLLVGAGSALLTVLTPETPVLVLVPPLVLIGAGMGLSVGVLDGAAVASVPPERAGTASGMFNTARLGGETVGIVIVGTILVALLHSSLRAALPGVDATEAANQTLSGNIVGIAGGNEETFSTLALAFTDAFHVMLWGMTVLTVATAVMTLLIMGRTPVSTTAGEDDTADSAIPVA
ncbi:MFS family permease [Rathayibacter agropyri]